MKCEQCWECVINWRVDVNSMKQSLFQVQSEVGLICSEDATTVCSEVVVIASSHRRSPGLITQKSQIRAGKQTPIWRYATVSQEAKLINFDIVNPL